MAGDRNWLFFAAIGIGALWLISKAKAAVNLLLNPSFEDASITPGMPANWNKWGTAVGAIYSYPEPGRTGGKSVAIEYPAQELAKDALWIQVIEIDMTKNHKLSGWLKTLNLTGWANIHVDWKTKTGVWVSASNIMTAMTGTMPWTYVEGIVTPDPSAEVAAVICQFTNGAGKVWFDELSFSQA